MYPTAEDLVEASDVEALTSISDEDVLAELRAGAINAVEAYCRQSFTMDDDPGGSGDGDVVYSTRSFEGTGQQTLYLDRRLSEMTAISFGGTAIDPDTFAVSTPHRNRITFSRTGFGTWASRAVAEMEEFGPVTSFPTADRIVEVEGVWGWTPAEYETELAAVTRALRLDMEDQAIVRASKLGDSVAMARKIGASTISQGNLSLDLSAREPGVSRRVQAALAARTPSGEILRWPIGAGTAI